MKDANTPEPSDDETANEREPTLPIVKPVVRRAIGG